MKNYSPHAVLLSLCVLPAGAAEIANSITEFSQTQGNQGWYTGWRNYTADGLGDAQYNANTSFLPFTPAQWNGTGFALGGNPPWTNVYAQNSHPNSGGAEHWVVRRWSADELTAVTPLRLTLHLKKTNATGNGTTGALFQNGVRKYSRAIAGADSTGFTDTFFLNVLPGDKIDFALTPVNPNGGRDDGSDGSAFTMAVDDDLGTGPYQQPDGTPFSPASAADSDADGMPDFWEVIFSPGGDLTTFTATGDYDGDELKDPDEYARASDPTKMDTDGDGLTDKVENKTGLVSAAGSGSDPAKADTDSDGLRDGDEVNSTPPTDPNLVDTDGDSYSDFDERFYGSNATLNSDTPLSLLVADSVADFSGVQGQGGWEYGYRNLTQSGISASYNPVADFIPFAGGSGVGDSWAGGAASTQHWRGDRWDLQDNAPWTELTATGSHPNGVNNGAEHWTVRRWKAVELTAPTPVTVYWLVRKSAAAGDGVTGAIFLNGRIMDTKTIGGAETVGTVRRLHLLLQATDILDFVHLPTGLLEGSDGSDGSGAWMRVDTRMAAAPVASDGVYFAVPGAADTDGDGLADGWEFHVTSDPTLDPPYAGNLDALIDDADDNDNDGLTNLQEQGRGSNPLLEDSDGDGLWDGVETGTGIFASAANTGTSPARADSDGDGLTDRQEVLAIQLPSNAWLGNSDNDLYNDANELRRDADPGRTTEYVNGFPTGNLAHSSVDFSGTQGPLWFYGYRNLSADGGAEAYDPLTQFIEFPAFNTNWAIGGNPPWTNVSAAAAHPNGPNNTSVHWAIRRIYADPALFPVAKPLAFWWHIRKQNNSASDGISAGLYRNGVLVDEAAITSRDLQGVTRIFYAKVEPGDRFDFALRHNGPGQTLLQGNDGNDGTNTTLRVSEVIPDGAVQPDGSAFPPVSDFQISSVTRNAATRAVTVVWPSETGKTYDLHYSTSLSALSWTLLTPAAGVPGTGALLSFTDNSVATTLPGPVRIFYRVSIR